MQVQQNEQDTGWDVARVNKVPALSLGTGTESDKSATEQNKPKEAALRKINMAKQDFNVGTWNVRTLWATGKLELLREELKNYKYDVIGISEVRWTGQGETREKDFIWSGKENEHSGGVGMLLSPRARRSLIGCSPVNSRIITARFKAQPTNLTIIQVYAPTSASTEEEIDEFYNDIEKVIKDIPKKDLMILTGDWNAKVGNDNTGWEEVMGRYGYGDKNGRGERLLEFVTTHNLFICNTRFEQKPCRKWTWESPDGLQKNLIDYVIVPRRWKTSVINCRSYRGADIGSDHSLVLCGIKLKLKKVWGRKVENCYRKDMTPLKNELVKITYQQAVKEQLRSTLDEENLNRKSEGMIKAMNHAMELVTSNKDIIPRNPWISKHTLQLASKRRIARLIKDSSPDALKTYKSLGNQIKKSAKIDKEAWVEGECDKIDKGLKRGNSREAFGLMRMLSKARTPRIMTLNSTDGKTLQSKEEILKRWTQYAQEMYKSKDNAGKMIQKLKIITPPTNNQSDDILYSEVRNAINKLKLNKSPGNDQITSEMLKAGGEVIIDELLELCNQAWKEGTVPKEWSRSVLIPIPKKGNLKECENYRTIALTSCIGKVFMMILLNRLKNHMEPLLSETQAGFRAGRSTIHQILTLRLIAEKAKRNNRKVYNCFIDFKKAFDTVEHEAVWAVLRSYGVNEKLVKVLESSYELSEAAVRNGSEIGDWVPTSVGVKQGDPLSPMLFIAYLDRIMDLRKADDIEKGGVKIGGKNIKDLRFADDIDIMEESEKALQNRINVTKIEGERAGMFMNLSKTKTMVFGEKEMKKTIQVDGRNIQNVEEFEYLGSLFTWDNNLSKDIKCRIGKASGTLANLKHLWSSKTLSIKGKIRLIQTCVFSVLLYASEAWSLKKRDIAKLLAFEMKCYRRVLGITWMQKIKNIEVRARIPSRGNIIDTIKERKLNLFGHICRMSDSNILKHTMFAGMQGKKKRGRPPREWMDDIEEWTGEKAHYLVNMAQDRTKWRELVRNIVGPNG